MREARAKAALLTLIMAALLAYLASLKLRLLRHRRRAAAAAAAPAPPWMQPQCQTRNHHRQCQRRWLHWPRAPAAPTWRQLSSPSCPLQASPPPLSSGWSASSPAPSTTSLCASCWPAWQRNSWVLWRRHRLPATRRGSPPQAACALQQWRQQGRLWQALSSIRETALPSRRLARGAVRVSSRLAMNSAQGTLHAATARRAPLPARPPLGRVAAAAGPQKQTLQAAARR